MTKGPSPHTESEEPGRFALHQGPLREILDLSLTLASQRIPHFIEYSNGSYRLEVGPDEAQRAGDEIREFLRENSGMTGATPASLPLGFSWAPLWFLVWPIVFFAVQSTASLNPLVLEYAGRCHSEKILGGEWWRVFTGLCLHADLQHIASNLLSGYFVLNFLLLRVRAGTALLSLFAAAGAANYLTAATAGGLHLSLGFSTAVFAALGALSSLQAKANIVMGPGAAKPWTPLVASFFLVTLLGLGENADIRAHFFGFFTGIAAGFVMSTLDRVLRSPASQVAAGAAAYALLAVSWVLALS